MAWTPIASRSVPSFGRFDFFNLTLNDFKVLQIILSGLTVDVDGVDIQLVAYVANANIASYKYASVANHHGSRTEDAENAAGSIRLVGSDVTFWRLGSAAGEKFGGEVLIESPSAEGIYKHFLFRSEYNGTSASLVHIHGFGGGGILSTGPISGFRIKPSIGSILAGKVALLGLNPSPGIWSTAWQNPNTQANAPSGYAGRTFALVIDSKLFAKTGTKVRVTFKAGSDEMIIGNAHIGLSAGSTAGSSWNFGTVVPLLFGGNAGVTIPAGGSATSDEASFEIDGTMDITIRFYNQSSQTPMYTPPVTGGAIAYGRYHEDDQGATLHPNPPGAEWVNGPVTNAILGITKVEVKD